MRSKAMHTDRWKEKKPTNEKNENKTRVFRLRDNGYQVTNKCIEKEMHEAN